MADQIITINTIFQLRRGEAALWALKDPTLRPGEPGFELDTGKLKIGNGEQNWNALPYISAQVDINELNQIVQQQINNELQDKNLISFGGIASNLYLDNNGNIDLRDNNQEPIIANTGEIYLAEDREFIWTGTKWSEFGNESLINTLATKASVETLAAQVEQIIHNGSSGVLVPASEEYLGGVKSSDKKDEIRVDENGIMHINEIGIDKLVNVDGIELVLDGGSADKNT